ncbi:MAG: hypothetical protein QXM54_03505 [Desulfurococcaceae archaeon]
MSITIRVSRDLRKEIERLCEIGEFRSLREGFDTILELGLYVYKSGVRSKIELEQQLDMELKRLKEEVKNYIKIKNELIAKVKLMESVQNIQRMVSEMYVNNKCDETVLEYLVKIVSDLKQLKDMYFKLIPKEKTKSTKTGLRRV